MSSSTPSPAPSSSLPSTLSSYLLTFTEYASPPRLPRLQSLYSDFTAAKHNNPAGFNANVAWWRGVLLGAVERGLLGSPAAERIVLRAGEEMVESLRWDGVGRPLAMGAVLAELAQTKTIYPLQAFLSFPDALDAQLGLPRRLASALVGRPLWWALQQLSLVGDGEDYSDGPTKWRRFKGDYVVLPLLEKAADAVFKAQSAKPQTSLAEKLYTPAGFASAFGALDGLGKLSETELQVLRKYLSRDRRVVVVEGEVIKFVEPHATAPQAVTEVDRGVLAMKTAAATLGTQITEIESQIGERMAKINQYLRAKQHALAKSYLRSRKQLEDLLLKRTHSLETLQGVLLKIEQAAGDIEIMRAYETSTATLRTLLTASELQRERVDETMDAMADALADHREVEDAMAIGGEAVGVDDAELEGELEELVREDREKEEREREWEKKVEDKQKEKVEEKEKVGVEETPREVVEEVGEEAKAAEREKTAVRGAVAA